jgi:hypothetical protein
MLSEIHGWAPSPRHAAEQVPTLRPIKQLDDCRYRNLAEPGVRRFLNRVQQLVAFDGHFEVGADGIPFANAFSHPYGELRNVEGRPRRHRGWNPAITLRYREIRQRFARLCTAHGELGALDASTLARVGRRDSRSPLVPWISNRNPVPLAVPPLTCNRCDRAALEDAAALRACGRVEAERRSGQMAAVSQLKALIGSTQLRAMSSRRLMCSCASRRGPQGPITNSLTP